MSQIKLNIKYIMILSAFIIISSFAYHLNTISYKEIPKDISKRFKPLGTDINIEENFKKDNAQYLIFSYIDNHTFKKYYGLAIYNNKLFNRYSFFSGNNGNSFFNTVYISQYGENGEHKYIVYGYNPNNIISYFKININNSPKVESILNEKFFIRIYKFNELKTIEEPKFFNKLYEDITSDINI